MTVGIYYATTTGKTEDVADRLHNFISSAESPKDVSDVDDLSEFEGLDGIICGIPTWNTGADEERSGTAWDSILEDIGELSLSEIGRAHVRTPVTEKSRMPSSA